MFKNLIAMTDLVSSKQEMSSLEIAEVTGKQHAHVMRDIKNLLNQGVSQSNFGLAEYSDSQGKTRPCYNLTPKGVLILASGYNPLLREKIINRLEELETQRKENEKNESTSKPSTFIPVNTFEIFNLTGRPHARIMRDIQKILEQSAGIDDFILRYRPERNIILPKSFCR